MVFRVAERTSLIGLLAAASAGVLVGAGVSTCSSRAPAHAVVLHAKLRAGAHAHVAGAAVTPLFAHLPASADPELARWERVELTTTRSSEDAAAEVAADPAFEEAFVEPEASLPSPAAAPDDGAREDDGDSCPIHTPSFESYQGYLGPAPHGIDAPAAWRRGVRGGGEQFADVEGGWNAAHEDLPGARMRHVAGKPIAARGWREHGTAVLGEVVGVDNGRGVVGIAPDVDRVFTASIDGPGVAGAIEAAAEALRPGDVLLIELQTNGPRGRWIPVEYFDDTFDVIRAATKRGVVVIEAAGNGGEDLDASAYKGRFDRGKRDSGAILIGAGGPPRAGFTDRARLDFSNYGARVDVQGWGRKVATLDYGDLQACDADDADAHAARHYTNEFSGTSSASPIVAGAALLLEGAARARGKLLAPRDLRELLVRTGTPQVGDLDEHIGPRPDLSRALSQ
jgi:subtilisin family serine protease